MLTVKSRKIKTLIRYPQLYISLYYHLSVLVFSIPSDDIYTYIHTYITGNNASYNEAKEITKDSHKNRKIRVIKWNSW